MKKNLFVWKNHVPLQPNFNHTKLINYGNSKTV